MIRWFARNHIAANFLLVAIILGGIWSASFWLPLEVRPSYTFNHVDIDIEYRGATAEDVALMRRVVGPKMGVKAAGGIRTYADAQRMIAAGASRIGASASVKIVGGAG